MSNIEQYFLLRDGESYGPYTVPQLRDMLTSGELKREDCIWREGMRGRMALGSLPGIEPREVRFATP